jgi:hypothetical protein
MAGGWRAVMESLSWEQLEPAAEATIADAAAALLWGGEDSRGVLARMTAATPSSMASSRLIISQVKPQPFPAAEENALGNAAKLELAAIPASVAPVWAATVAAAVGDATRRAERARELGCWAEWSAEATKMHALVAIAQWGQDPLPLGNIKLLARAATRQRAWAPQPMA